MKKLLFPAIVFFSSIVFSNAQNSTSIEPIMEEGLTFVKEIEKNIRAKPSLPKQNLILPLMITIHLLIYQTA